MIQGVMFDVGGTLKYLERDRFDAMGAFTAATFLRSRGFIADADAFAEALIVWRRKHPKEGSDYKQTNTTRENLSAVAQKFQLELPEPLLAAVEEAFNRASVSTSIALPGIQDLVLDLQDRVKLAVVSNTRSHQLIEGVLKQLGLEVAFQPVITSAACGYRKPSPRIFQQVLDAWQLAPETLVMVGDLPHKDVKGAKALGIKTIWLRTDAKPCEHHGADAVADMPADIRDILATWGLKES